MSSELADGVPPTPNAWIEALDENDADLVHVRMLWRRGNGHYRPLTREGIDPAELERATSDEWQAAERADSHLHWATSPGESVEARRHRLRSAATHLWTVAQHWARDRGPVIDFQLRGYGEEDAVLFEIGKRFRLPQPRSGRDHTDDERDTDSRDTEERVRRREERLLGDFDQMHRTYGDILTRLARERNEAVATTRETTRVTPNLLTSAGAILKDAIAYQSTQVANLIRQANGRIELEALEIRERHRNQRREQTQHFVSDIFATVLGVGVPLAVQLSQVWASRKQHAVPVFERAQQAIAYLGLTMTDGQLRMLFSSDESSRSFVEVLADAAQVHDEREAIRRLVGLERLFRSQRWIDSVTAEQQIAARFILGRAALYRMETFADEQ